MRISSDAAGALLAGLIMACAFPPFGLGFLAFIALVPLLMIMVRTSPGTTALWAFVAGLVLHIITISWIWHSTVAGMVLAIVTLSFFWTLPFVAGSLAVRRFGLWGLIVFPFAVAGFEWARSFDLLAFPWVILAMTQTYYPWLIQFADITSAFGVSAWVALVNVTIFLLVRRQSPRYTHIPVYSLLLVGLFAAPAIYSHYVIQRGGENGRTIRVALVQGNVMPDEKWTEGGELANIDLYRRLSAGVQDQKPDLYIWPETAVPVYLNESPGYLSLIRFYADSTGVPILTGAPTIEAETNRTWNAACLIEPFTDQLPTYEKIHLVPFGEAIPLDTIFPSLRKIEMGQANWDRGTRRVVFKPHELPPFSVAICFESVFPDLMRSFIVKGAEFIVVITNDVWFGPLIAPRQHAMASVLRAIEFHRPVARCANSGISLFVDPWGRITDETETFTRTTLVGDISPQQRMTFYARHGNLFSMASMTVTALACVWCFASGKSNAEKET